MYQFNKSVTFSEKPMGPKEFLNQMGEALGITIDRRFKGRPCKMGSQTIEKIGYVSILIKKIEGEGEK